MPRAMRRERGKTRVVHVSARSLDVNVVDAAERAGKRASERASERAATAAANVSTASQRIRVFATRADLTVVR